MTTSASTPPRLAAWLLARVLPLADAEYALGDLDEDFHALAAAAGPAVARRWYWRQAWRCTARRLVPSSAGEALAAIDPGGLMRNLIQDLFFGARIARRTLLISTAAVATFALGIGANAAVFSVAWPILGESLPFPEEERLAHVLLSIERESGRGSNPISPGDYLDLLRARSFESLAAYNLFTTPRNLVFGEDAQQIRVGSVTERFFDTLGVTPVHGRGLQPADFEAGANALVLAESTWRRHFGMNPDAIGRTIRLDGQHWTVVGVMPDHAMLGTVEVDAWQAQLVDPATARQQRSYFLAMIGRLADGVSLEAANRELRNLMLGVAERYPESNRLPEGMPVLAHAESFRDRLTGPVRPAFLLLIAAAALVLLVAATNLAGLQLARNVARRQEIAVRRALGASRGRVVRQMLTESLLLAGVGGLVGIGAAALTLGAIRQMAPRIVWHDIAPTLSADVVAFTVGLALLSALLVGLPPAIAASAGDHLSDSSRGGSAGKATTRSRNLVLAAQVAVSVVLLIGAALVGGSLARVLRIDPGFAVSNALVADVRFVGESREGIAFYDDLVTRVEALPGVERACAMSLVPLDGEAGGMTFVAEGETFAERQGALRIGVTDGCFETLRMQVLAGRGFHRQETTSVAIVSESMGRALWPDESPVGKRVHIGLETGPLFEVVGVVSDIRASSLESDATRQMWFSSSRAWPMPERLVVRSAVPPETLGASVRAVVSDIDPDLALANIHTLQDVIDDATAPRRFVLVLLGSFAVIAVALCAVGIYGVLAYQVGQRTREMGVRLALGARVANVVAAVGRQVLTAAGAGIAAGVAAAWWLSSLLTSQLYEVSATDARVYGAVALFVVAVVTIAAAPPIRRALRIEPGRALRD